MEKFPKRRNLIGLFLGIFAGGGVFLVGQFTNGIRDGHRWIPGRALLAMMCVVL